MELAEGDVYEVVKRALREARCRVLMIRRSPGLGRVIADQGSLWAWTPRGVRKRVTVYVVEGGPQVRVEVKLHVLAVLVAIQVAAIAFTVLLLALAPLSLAGAIPLLALYGIPLAVAGGWLAYVLLYAGPRGCRELAERVRSVLEEAGLSVERPKEPYEEGHVQAVKARSRLRGPLVPSGTRRGS